MSFPISSLLFQPLNSPSLHLWEMMLFHRWLWKVIFLSHIPQQFPMPSKQYIHYWILCDLIISWHNKSKTCGRESGDFSISRCLFYCMNPCSWPFLLSWISTACRALGWERSSSLPAPGGGEKLIQRNPLYPTAVAFPALDFWSCFLFHNLHKLNIHLFFFPITCFTNQCLKCNIESLLSTQASCAGFTVAACQEPEGFTCAQVR